MKLLSVILFATLAAFAVAQGIVIGYPPANKQIHPGQKLTVQVVQPVGLCFVTGDYVRILNFLHRKALKDPLLLALRSVSHPVVPNLASPLFSLWVMSYMLGPTCRCYTRRIRVGDFTRTSPFRFLPFWPRVRPSSMLC